MQGRDAETPEPPLSQQQPPDTQAVAESLGVGAAPRRRGWIYAVLGLGGVAVVGTVFALRGGEAGWDYDTAPIEEDDLTVEITAIGTLEPLHSVSISSDVSGTVARVHVETNDTVKAGQVLAELDTALLDSELRRTRAATRAADATLVQARVSAQSAQQELGRAEKLHAAGVVSDASLDQARSARDQAVAAVAVAEAQAEQAKAALASTWTQHSKTTITSPIDGVVLARNVDPGQAVVSSLQAATLFEVAETLDRMSVDVEIDEADIGQVAEGQKADFTVAAWPDKVFDAQVHKVELAPKQGTAVVTYIACLHLDNPDGLLRPGMTATARIETRTWEDVVLVPNAALRWAPESAADLPPPAPREGKQVQRVWRFGTLDLEPEPVEVVTAATDGRRSVVLEGELSAGDEVVVDATEVKRGGR